jgi:hypothetical protein
MSQTGPLGDIAACRYDVRFTPESGHRLKQFMSTRPNHPGVRRFLRGVLILWAASILFIRWVLPL